MKANKLLKMCGLFTLPFLAVLLSASLQAFAQTVNIDVGDGPTSTARIVQLILLVTVLALAPSILVMATSVSV